MANVKMCIATYLIVSRCASHIPYAPERVEDAHIERNGNIKHYRKCFMKLSCVSPQHVASFHEYMLVLYKYTNRLVLPCMA